MDLNLDSLVFATEFEVLQLYEMDNHVMPLKVACAFSIQFLESFCVE